MLAVNRGNIGIILLLLTHNATMDLHDLEDETAQTLALKNGRSDIVDLLTKYREKLARGG